MPTDLPRSELLEAENDALIENLELFGVRVHLPNPITSDQAAANYGAARMGTATYHEHTRAAIEGGDLLVLGKTVVARTRMNPRSSPANVGSTGCTRCSLHRATP